MPTAGYIFDIQRASMNDGPGIRTTIFLQGCPLACAWCHNPEGISPDRQGIADTSKIRRVSVDELMPIILRDRHYYTPQPGREQGGLTLSGGEPMLQPHFSAALLSVARESRIHTCLQTSGMASLDVFKKILPLVDLFLYDYKATAEQFHRRCTGASNRSILRNLRCLCENGASIILRCPLVPGLNDTPQHFEAIAELFHAHHAAIRAVEIMPYHLLGAGKLRSNRQEATRYAVKIERYSAATSADIGRWHEELLRRGVRISH